MKSGRSYHYFDIIMAVFVTVLVVSNVASSAKIVDLKFSLAGVPMAFDAGTLLFPISYIFGDILTEVYGYAQARRVIWMGFFCNLLAVTAIWIAGLLPAAPFWQGRAAYQSILGFTPRLLDPSEQLELLPLGYGITNLVARTTATADELSPEELLAGQKRLITR